MPDTITVHPATIDWHHDTRRDWQAAHDRFQRDMNLVLIEAHVTPLDIDSLFESEPGEPPVCECCNGNGWLMASDPRRPWREVKTECWECQ